jgi:DNA modification methylase
VEDRRWRLEVEGGVAGKGRKLRWRLEVESGVEGKGWKLRWRLEGGGWKWKVEWKVKAGRWRVEGGSLYIKHKFVKNTNMSI